MPVEEFTTEELESEEWRPAFEFDKYLVSSLGRVRRIVARRAGKPTLSPRVGIGGYCYVYLSGKTRRNLRLHRLVLLSFHLPPTPRHQVNHKDGIKTNNRLSNLEWVTGSENIKHAFALGLKGTGPAHKWYGKPDHVRGENNGNSKLTKNEVIMIRERYRLGGISTRRLALEYKVSRTTIKDILRRKTWFYVE